MFERISDRWKKDASGALVHKSARCGMGRSLE
jgi:hypothetical protein